MRTAICATLRNKCAGQWAICGTCGGVRSVNGIESRQTHLEMCTAW
jgi:hypothetical protein